jgi:hypothetical protein
MDAGDDPSVRVSLIVTVRDDVGGQRAHVRDLHTRRYPNEGPHPSSRPARGLDCRAVLKEISLSRWAGMGVIDAIRGVPQPRPHR